jgi:hypothetical protein
MIGIPSVNPYALDSRFLIGYLSSLQYGFQEITWSVTDKAIPLLIILYENVCQWMTAREHLWYYKVQSWIKGLRTLFLFRMRDVFPNLYPNEWDFRRSVLQGSQFYYRDGDFWNTRQWLPLDYGPSVRGRFEDMLRLFWEWLHGNTELESEGGVL